MTTSVTQLTLRDLRCQLAKLQDLQIQLCDTFAYSNIIDAIHNVKREINETAGIKMYSV